MVLSDLYREVRESSREPAQDSLSLLLNLGKLGMQPTSMPAADSDILQFSQKKA